ncbi:UDP-GalNAc:beta-1,3-N-acetylgalactosaminyltransferase 2 precursor [Danio rerio]|uniref:UDP-GalNAc:beta-1,3-N-acetylgalactosaminyltransferase 2 n=1 Tax=Danio rerio TaxID=7955 RepID=B3GL2_DANRE|nr:UDP-GalNAc:beta-1,3-N-acetylgalactosaminyltransferase 2 precursor [Danio rerio]Q502B3.1 RecName: Full=UDP-GalNAc:beta-1,3-N-acetylgalactosaminyltransferase 2; Short=Beta-1,3-GalNAc-T2; AltName: Full=Beta-1,3-N-acetylgalactosaminyltransferase II [Danio rerio]AAH95777.1 Beta-1,3-N-acetylgalactosaminyltransferase 2 [Danio rerio]|eukprot:NP_001018523.1 UDP-GalNAc:beta-1,3-N-acetylgalactosaminyltransferase 2 precursor [Danio rerio]
MRSAAAALSVCVLAVLLHWICWTDRSAELLGFRAADRPKADVREVLVGVLSARHNHELRQAIRDTWLGYLKQHPHFQNRVLVKFIIGAQGCSVPLEDLEDQYSCSQLELSEAAVSGQEMAILSVPDSSALLQSDVPVLSLDFKVLHSVVITQLGVFPNKPPHYLKGNITVRLLQVDQEEAVISARFSSVSPGTAADGMFYKPVEQFILPKGFEGTLLWEAEDSTALMSVNTSALRLNNGGGVLHFRSIEEGTLPHRNALGFPGLAGGFTFTVYDVEVLSEMLRGRSGRQKIREAQLKGEDEALQEESLRHGDMVFVDVVGTYRNVPSKLLQFYKWSVENADFSLLLKTDDDCFIDVDAVLMKMQRRRLTHTSLWWGNFRQNWAVDRVGKWQELEYASPAYPAFACGSGYVVSRDLVQWLASNAQHLKAYQGEDVSMGIWMAAVGPRKYQDSGWLCEKECYVDMLSSPQHSAEELRLLWSRKNKCGDPCGCS